MFKTSHPTYVYVTIRTEAHQPDLSDNFISECYVIISYYIVPFNLIKGFLFFFSFWKNHHSVKINEKKTKSIAKWIDDRSEKIEHLFWENIETIGKTYK